MSYRYIEQRDLAMNYLVQSIEKELLPREDAEHERLIKREVKRFEETVLQLATHCHNVLPVKIVYEDDFLNEIEKRTPKKRILGIGFLRN